jgi:hypothetical protein
MSRTSLRIGVATGAVLLTLGAAADAARACNLPKIAVSPPSAGPGEPVTWKIGDIEPRATYTVTVAGQSVAEGQTGASPPSGSFSMPDLGSTPRSVFVEMEVRHTEASPTHEEGNNGWRNSDTVIYQPPSPPPHAPPQEPPGSAPGTPAPADDLSGALPKNPRRTQKGAREVPRNPGPPTRRPATREPAPQRPARTRSPVPVGGTQIPDTATAPAGVEPRATGRSTVDARARSTVNATVRSTVNATDGSAATATNRSAAAGVDRSAVRSKSSPAEAVDPITHPRPQTSRTVPLVQPPGKVIRPLEDGDAVPGIVLVGLSALLVLGLGATAIWVLRPRGSPPASRLAAGGPQWVPPGLGLEARNRDLLIEAELQELIAEERARRVAREAAAIRTGPG